MSNGSTCCVRSMRTRPGGDCEVARLLPQRKCSHWPQIEPLLGFQLEMFPLIWPPYGALLWLALRYARGHLLAPSERQDRGLLAAAWTWNWIRTRACLGPGDGYEKTLGGPQWGTVETTSDSAGPPPHSETSPAIREEMAPQCSVRLVTVAVTHSHRNGA